MALRPQEPLFLERQTYRRRRLMDAARLLPVVGLALWLFPMMWAGPDVPDPASTAMGGVYLFAVWTVLIGAAFVVSRQLVRSDPPPTPPRDGPDHP